MNFFNKKSSPAKSDELEIYKAAGRFGNQTVTLTYLPTFVVGIGTFVSLSKRYGLPRHHRAISLCLSG
jgi:hypothetical protein